MVIDPENIKIELSFLETDFQNIEHSILEKYTIKAWVDDIFFNEGKPEDFFNHN